VTVANAGVETVSDDIDDCIIDDQLDFNFGICLREGSNTGQHDVAYRRTVRANTDPASGAGANLVMRAIPGVSYIQRPFTLT